MAGKATVWPLAFPALILIAFMAEKSDSISGAGFRIDPDNAEFKTVMTLIRHTNRSVFLTGKAGTGKSTFLRYLTAGCPKKFVVLAPTGIAAVNVGGQTLHSFFHLPFTPFLPDDPTYSEDNLKRRLKYSHETIRLIREIELIIIDEISMVRADIIDFIDKILRVYTGRRREPFGGRQLLLVGDVFQLEPVVTSGVREILQRAYSTPYFFKAHVFDGFDLVAVELRKVYRQCNPDFVAMLDRVRIGRPTPGDMKSINARVMRGDSDAPGSTDDFSMTIATRRDIVDHINDERLEALTTPSRTYVGSTTGEFPETAYPTDLELILKVGAQVVFIKNDMDRRWVNGTIGRIHEATDDVIMVELEDGSVHSVEVEKWSNIRYRYDEETGKVSQEEIGTFMQYPLKLAWALTIHKSQGLTFDRVTVDVGRGAFSGGQTYVALSRCRSLEGISLRSTINERDIFVSPVIHNFSRTFNDRQAVDNALASARADDAYREALTAFDAGDIHRAVMSLCEAATLRNDLVRPEIARFISRKLSVIDGLREQIRELGNLLADDQRRFRELADEYVAMGDDCRSDSWDMQAALANYERALALWPDSVDAMIGKAKALFEMNEADTAISVLERASHVDGTDYRAPYELGRFFQSCGDMANALDRLMIAVDRNPRIPLVHDALAEIYDETDDRKSARMHRAAAARLRGRSSRK